MIKLDITGNKYELDDKLVEYVQKKLGGLEKYLPKEARLSAHGSTVLSFDKSGREGNDYVCEATVTVPHAKLHSKEATGNMYAAVDVVEAKLKVQIARYKQKQNSKAHGLKGIVARLARKEAAEKEKSR